MCAAPWQARRGRSLLLPGFAPRPRCQSRTAPRCARPRRPPVRRGLLPRRRVPSARCRTTPTPVPAPPRSPAGSASPPPAARAGFHAIDAPASGSLDGQLPLHLRRMHVALVVVRARLVDGELDRLRLTGLKQLGRHVLAVLVLDTEDVQVVDRRTLVLQR